MVNKPLIRPYFLGGVALRGVARIPLIYRGYNPTYPPPLLLKLRHPIIAEEL